MFVGVTGGIGSGKSTVASMLREHGAAVVDADGIARDLVKPGAPALAALKERFGADIIGPDGSLLRAELAQRAFSDPASTQDLNEIMHPRIQYEARKRLNASTSDVTVYDMPLLVETRQRDLVDLVVVVDLPETLQVQRAVATERFSAEQVRQRMAAQATREERLAQADVVIDNSGTLEDLAQQVERLWKHISVLAGTNDR